MKTYIIEIYNSDNDYYEIVEYCNTLRDAKRIAKKIYKNTEKVISILQLQGQYFGEGFHQYRLKLNDGNFTCIETMNLSKKKVGRNY